MTPASRSGVDPRTERDRTRRHGLTTGRSDRQTDRRITTAEPSVETASGPERLDGGPRRRHALRLDLQCSKPARVRGSSLLRPSATSVCRAVLAASSAVFTGRSPRLATYPDRGRRTGMANVPGDVSDVGAGGVERRHDGAAARMRAEGASHRSRFVPPARRSSLSICCRATRRPSGWVNTGSTTHRFVGVGLPQRPGRQTLLRLSLPPRSQPFDRAGGEVVHTRGASGLRRAKRSALSTVDDRPADSAQSRPRGRCRTTPGREPRSLAGRP